MAQGPQETFEAKAPQREALGTLESRLPAPARRRPFANIVLALAVVLSVFGIGGARLKGAQGAALAQFTAADEYGHGIPGDLSTQADAAASLIRQTENVLGESDAAVTEARQALDAFNAAPTGTPGAAYDANVRLYSAVEMLYNAAKPEADGTALKNIEGLHAAFVSAQTTIDRAGARYNEAAKAYNKTAAAFPANVIGALWGAGEAPLFAS